MLDERLRILIIEPHDDDGPAHLARWLRRARRPYTVVSIEANVQVPASAEAWDAIAMLGGPMSVNDGRKPWLKRAQAFMQDAIARGRPIIGHCLGGQMLAKSLGAVVGPSPQPEIGWCDVEATDDPLAAEILGPERRLRVFQWHEEAFALPAGAVRLAGNAACPNQAFAFGPHVGLQFHVEVDDEKLGRWHVEAGQGAAALRQFPNVQDEAAMRADTARCLADSQRLAERLYTRWLALAQANKDLTSR